MNRVRRNPKENGRKIQDQQIVNYGSMEKLYRSSYERELQEYPRYIQLFQIRLGKTTRRARKNESRLFIRLVRSGQRRT